MDTLVMSQKEDLKSSETPKKSSYEERIVYSKEFLLSCFRNPAAKRRPPTLPTNAEFTLNAPKSTSNSPFTPVVSYSQPRMIPRPVGHGHPHHSERYGNPNFHYHPPDRTSTSARESKFIGMFFDKNPQQSRSERDIPKTDVPCSSAPESISMPRNLQNCFRSQDEVARDLGDSLRNMLLIGQPLQSNATSFGNTQIRENHPQNPNDANQRAFKKIMDELVMKGTDKLLFKSN